ncbi:hypothetical protein FYJ24_09315 [Actinomycetaceae bacterium WB03_NA08]|uniref:Holin n=1 Tax=Scrofimicrobium canadense TaxID=2652290 RepID=A0A6N7VT49_9ACTO|nr:hypothetical protein [Scrofimicrobium canadense]MSS84957.1 hypothetical protein [Scrofimicrobium canadense]
MTAQNPYPKRASVQTQAAYPWHTVARTIFQAVIGFAAAWALIVEAAGVDQTIPWVATSLAITAAITRIMALPQVNEWLSRFIPWLAPEGKTKLTASQGDPVDENGDPLGALTDSE